MLLLLLLSFALSPRVEGGEIIGGHEVRPHSRPYMAYLKTYNKNSGKTFQCGGFLIRKDVVLTAAHCHESLINVILGAHNIQQYERTWQKISVLKTILHPNFKYKKCSNDIMLLKIQRPKMSHSSCYPMRFPGKMLLLLLLLSLAPSPKTEAGEIIGGHEAKPHSRPYMAFLKYVNENTGEKSRCGGFLIRKNVVLTAAHCKGRAMTVTLGAHNIKQKEESQQVIPVSKALPHPDYDSKRINNDIMLLKLKSNAKMTKAVKPITLPGPRNKVRPGQVCSVAGWGKVAPRSNYPAQLLEVELKVQADKECQSYLKGYYNPATQLCAGNNKEQKATFTGDSGGPLVCKNVAQGIVSYGWSNGTSPRAYTRIFKFMSWIKTTLRKM